MDAALLATNHCYFGGGTAMALRYGEYRESVDIDFLVSDNDGYRALRQLMTGVGGLRTLMREDSQVLQSREVKADRYGLRTMVEVAGSSIRLEIVSEGRIEFDIPGQADHILGVACLTPLDMAASKLLANSDRWRDDAISSRDLIDLAMMRPGRALMKLAIEKARAAYGDAIERDLGRAIALVSGTDGRLERCMRQMNIEIPKAELRTRINALARRAPHAPTAK